MAGVDVGTAYLTVIPSARGFAGKLQGQMGSGMDKAGKDAGTKAATGFGSTFGSGIKASSLAGAAMLAGIAAGGIAFAKGAISEARESQKVGALTAQVIKTTGGAAKVTAGQVGDLAMAISNKTGIDDEAIQSASNLLLTFTNVRNEVGKGNDVFSQATQIATDMGAALGGDPKQSAIQLGKALNDPVKGVTALQRVGVSFTAQQKEQIKTMTKSGDTLGAQKLILGELNKEFGGAAAASATAGEKMSTAFGNFKEQIGTALLPVLDKAETFITTKVIPAVSKFFTEMQNGTGKGGAFVDFLKRAATKFGEFVTAGKKIVGFLNDHRTAVVAATAAVVALVAITKVHSAVMAVQAAGGILKMIQSTKIVTALTKTWTAVQWLMNAALTANPIALVVVAIAVLVAALIYAYKNSQKFRDIVTGAFDMIKLGALELSKVAVQAFKFLANIYMTVVETLVKGAAKAFGWVPGLGPKLKGAAAAVSTFKNDANAALSKIENNLTVSIATAKAKQEADALERYFHSRNWTVTAKANVSMVYSGNGQVVSNVPKREHGGPVRAGQPYIVGEKRPELFVPNQSGTIVPHVPTGGGKTDLSDSSVQRLAVALAGVQVQATVSAGSFDRAMGAGLR